MLQFIFFISLLRFLPFVHGTRFNILLLDVIFFWTWFRLSIYCLPHVIQGLTFAQNVINYFDFFVTLSVVCILSGIQPCFVYVHPKWIMSGFAQLFLTDSCSTETVFGTFSGRSHYPVFVLLAYFPSMPCFSYDFGIPRVDSGSMF